MADLLSSGSDRPPRRWIGVAAVIVLLAGAGIYLGLRDPSNSSHRPDSPAKPTVSETAPTSSTSNESLGHPLLGITGKWELFGRNVDSVVRVRLAKGLISRTAVPLLSSGGPVSFLVTGDRAIIRPLDRVDGFWVPDGGRARTLTGPMGFSGPFLPGPDPNTVWIPNNDSNTRISMQLVTANGRSMHQQIRFLRQKSGFPAPDGDGYLLGTTADGIYDLRPGGARRITRNSLLAAGPTGWLTAKCDPPRDCRLTVTDRSDGRRHNLGTYPESIISGPTTIAPTGMPNPLGVISPDGADAALITTTGIGPSADLHLLSLRTGVDELIGVPLDPRAIQTGTAVWSPDSRWLFVAGGAGKVYAVDARSSSVHYLGDIPPVTQLAIRPTAGA